MSYEREEKTQSPLEVKFLHDCAAMGLIVEPQYAIGPIHCDFAVPEQRLAIECDSDQWHSTPEQKANDMERNKIYEANGWKVLRFRSRDILGCGEFIAMAIKAGYGELSLSKAWGEKQKMFEDSSYYFGKDDDEERERIAVEGEQGEQLEVIKENNL